MGLGPYSPWKFIHHQDRIKQLKDGEQINPTFIMIIPSDLCNHDCSFCAYRMSGYTSNEWFGEKDPITGLVENNPNRMIPYEKIIEIIDDCEEMDVKAIEWTGGGEPTVHPKAREFFEYSLHAGRDNGLVTNGTVLRNGMPELLAQFKWVRVSIDAGTAQSYASIRSVPESFFTKSLENIGRIAEAKAKSQTSDLVLGVGYVVTRENYREIDQAVKIYKDLGVDNVRISAVFTPEDAGYFEGIYEECRDAARDAVARYGDESFRVFNLFGDRLSDLEQGKPDYEFCGFQQIQSYIGGDLNVYRCCNTSYNPQGFLGSIKNQRFKELWASRQKKNAIGSFDARTCSRCQFNAKNKFINYVLEDDPEHVNFV